MRNGCKVYDADTHVMPSDILMYASNDPHSECHFPNSVDHVSGWASLKPATRQKLLWDNATRFYKQTWERRRLPMPGGRQ